MAVRDERHQRAQRESSRRVPGAHRGPVDRRDHAGHGWGRALIEWAARATADAGHDRLRLDTAAHNTTMVDYYRALGFTVLREADLPAHFGRDMRIVLFERHLDT